MFYTRSKHLWIAASVADTAAVSTNGNKTILANGFSTLPVKVKSAFINGPISLPKNHLDGTILFK